MQQYRLWRYIVFCVICACATSVTGQCTGTVLVLTATDDYKVFTSVNYPYGYGNDRDCVWLIEADNVTDAIRLEITDISIEYHADCVYDFGEVFDGYNYTYESLGRFCGTTTSNFVSTDQYMTVRFKSDYSLYSKGFKARYKSGIRSTLLDEEETTTTISSFVIIGASVGIVALMLFIIGMIFTYFQLKKAKDIRRNRNGRMSRVEPMYGAWSYLDGPAPPAYGEIYSSPMSPPPMYSEVDPNLNPADRLPGRAEYMDNNTSDVENGASTENHSQQRRGDTNANTHFVVPSSIHMPSTSALTSGQHVPRTNVNQGADDGLNIPGSVPPSAQTSPTRNGASNTTSNINTAQGASTQDTQGTNNLHTNVPSAGDTSSSNVERRESVENEHVGSAQIISNAVQNQSISLPNAVETIENETRADNNIGTREA